VCTACQKTRIFTFEWRNSRI